MIWNAQYDIHIKMYLRPNFIFFGTFFFKIDTKLLFLDGLKYSEKQWFCIYLNK